MINFEVSLTLAWSQNCVLTDIITQAARNPNPNADSSEEVRENATFRITDTKYPSC